MNRPLLALTLGIVLTATSCHSGKKEEADQVVYTVTTPKVTTTQITKDYVASIHSQKNIDLRSQVEGILQNIYVDEGQTVKAGQPLFRIAIVGAQEEVSKSAAEATQARIDLQNTEKLATNNIVSGNARKMAQAKYEAAMADYRTAVLRKKLSVVYAPFAGIMGRIPNKPGSMLQAGDLLSTLSDNTNMYVYFNVSEPEYLDYQLHAAERSKLPLTLILANGEPFPAKGFIQNVEGEFDSETGNIPFRAKFANAGHVLLNGETGTVRMNIPRTHALVIPQQSTYELQDRRYVFVVDAHSVVHARQIEVADEQPGIFVVAKGLSPRDRILVDGVQKVNDGERIQFKIQN